MITKKYFIGLAVIGLLFVPASFPTQAQTTDAEVIMQLQAQIYSLQQAIRELPQLMSAPRAASLAPQTPILLRPGARGQEVKDLQSFLKKEGHFPAIEPTGYFGDITKESLEKFQLKQGIFSADAPVSVGRGELGRITRDVISSKQMTTTTQALIPIGATSLPPTSTGGGTIQLPAGYSEKIQLLSPNGGEIWQIGQVYPVQYSLVQSQPGVAPAKVLVYLEQGYPPGSPKVGVNSAILLGIGDGSGSLSVSLPNWPGPSALSKIRVCGGLGCEFTSDSSDGFFTVTAPPILTDSIGGIIPYTISDSSQPQPTIQLPAGYSEKIQLLSPNGGEVLVNDNRTQFPVRLSIPTDRRYEFDAYLIPHPGNTPPREFRIPPERVAGGYSVGGFSPNYPYSPYAQNWVFERTNTPAGSYKFRIYAFPFDGYEGYNDPLTAVAWDESDGVITVAEAAAPVQEATLAGLPLGCTSASGFSPVTGVSCSSVTTTPTLPSGCISTTGFSPMTGVSCSEMG